MDKLFSLPTPLPEPPGVIAHTWESSVGCFALFSSCGLPLIGGEAGDRPELEGVGVSGLLQLGFELLDDLSVLEVEVALDQVHEAHQRGSAALPDFVEAGGLEHGERELEEQLGSHREGVAEIVVAQHEGIQRLQGIPHAAISGQDRGVLRRIGKQPPLIHPGALGDAAREVRG